MNKNHPLKIISSLAAGITCAVCIAFFSCASKPVQKPLWASYDTIELVYPSTEYIARIGTGDSAQTAGLLAEGELASYFSHTVEASAKASQTMVSAAGSTTKESRMIERTVNVESLMKLSAVHKTTAWFDREGRQYVCCAYINREEVWQVYEGKIFSEREHFLSFFQTAQAEKDSLRRMLLLKKAGSAARNYLDTLDFARLLSPVKESAYAKDRAAIARLDIEWEKAKKEAVMSVTVKEDSAGIIFRCLTSLLAEEGFVLTPKAAQAVYTVRADIQPNKVRHAEMLTAEPGISIYIYSGAQQAFSYAKTLERISGFTEAEKLVDKKIYASLERELQASFLQELRTALQM